jgi:hypothetical protein
MWLLDERKSIENLYKVEYIELFFQNCVLKTKIMMD